MNDYQKIANEAIALCQKFYNTCIAQGFEPFGLANTLGGIYFKYIASVLNSNLKRIYKNNISEYENERAELFRVMENTFMMVPGTLERDIDTFTTDRIQEGICDFGGRKMVPIIDTWCKAAKKEFSERLG